MRDLILWCLVWVCFLLYMIARSYTYKSNFARTASAVLAGIIGGLCGFAASQAALALIQGV